MPKTQIVNSGGNYSGKRGRTSIKGSTKVYPGKGEREDELIQALQSYYLSKGLDTDTEEQDGYVIMKAMKFSIPRFLFGLNRSVTVSISRQGDDLLVATGGAEVWDKCLSVFLGVFFWYMLLPLLLILTCIVGNIKQMRLHSATKKQIKNILK
jgi:hypothetical protein